MHRGDASNSARVLTRLTSSGAMLVFLCDFVGVLSGPTGGKETSGMKLRL